MRIGVLIVCAVALALGVPAQALTLATGGQARATIVVATGATAAEKTAANEVADYLRQISGADFRVLPEDQAPAQGSRVFIGPTAFARSRGLAIGSAMKG